LLRLVVEYDSADDFLSDHAENLGAPSLFVETTRNVEPGTIIELGLTFPGLLQPIVLDAFVQQGHENGLTLVLLEGGRGRLQGLAQRIRDRDPKLVAPVLNVLIVEDNKHVCELVRQGLVGSTRREMRDV